MERVEQARVEGQHDLKNLSNNSIFVESAYPVHEIHLTQPDLVVKAIQRVLESVKTGSPITPLPVDH
jgi:hypothetical protein